MSVDTRWYVVHTYSGYENKVATNIEKMVENRKMQDQILEVKIPTEIVTDVEKKKEVERKLFPGYVLVKVAVSPDRDNRPAMSDETWLLIRNTRGVTGFVGPENKAIPMLKKCLERALCVTFLAAAAGRTNRELMIIIPIHLIETVTSKAISTLCKIDFSELRSLVMMISL